MWREGSIRFAHVQIGRVPYQATRSRQFVSHSIVIVEGVWAFYGLLKSKFNMTYIWLRCWFLPKVYSKTIWQEWAGAMWWLFFAFIWTSVSLPPGQASDQNSFSSYNLTAGNQTKVKLTKKGQLEEIWVSIPPCILEEGADVTVYSVCGQHLKYIYIYI